MSGTKPKLHHLNWNLLHTFLVIVEERSITRAADRLLVRQPTVSAALQRLEETLGGQLIQRDSRRFVAGLGIGILPLASVAEALESRSLWNLARPEDLLGADLYFISNPAMQLSAAEEAFLRLFEQRLSATEEEPAAEAAEALLSDPPAP